MAVLVTAIHADMKREIAPKMCQGFMRIGTRRHHGPAWKPVTSMGMTAMLN
jgi:hypothetical protein